MAGKSVEFMAGRIAGELAEKMGYTFVGAALEQEHGADFLRIFVDFPGGIDLQKCESFHRAIADLVDDLDFDYLEVSSPGLDRPLKTKEDYTRMIGQNIELRLHAKMDGRKKIAGALLEISDGELRLQTSQGELQIALDKIEKALPVIEMKE